MKKCLIFVLLVICCLYVNVDVVSAETNPITCDYGVICNYSMPNIADTAGGYTIGGSTMIVYYQCNDKSKKLNNYDSKKRKTLHSQLQRNADIHVCHAVYRRQLGFAAIVPPHAARRAHMAAYLLFHTRRCL